MSGAGSAALQQYRAGLRLTPGQAIAAMHASCMNDFIDGRSDCGVVSCPLFPTRPYRDPEPAEAPAEKKAIEGTEKRANGAEPASAAPIPEIAPMSPPSAKELNLEGTP